MPSSNRPVALAAGRSGRWPAGRGRSTMLADTPRIGMQRPAVRRGPDSPDSGPAAGNAARAGTCPPARPRGSSMSCSSALFGIVAMSGECDAQSGRCQHQPRRPVLGAAGACARHVALVDVAKQGDDADEPGVGFNGMGDGATFAGGDDDFLRSQVVGAQGRRLACRSGRRRRRGRTR